MLGCHNIVRTAVSFAGNHGNLWNRRFRKSVKQLSTVLDNTAVLLVESWQKSRDINKRKNWDVEAVAKADKARGFTDALMSKQPASTMG